MDLTVVVRENLTSIIGSSSSYVSSGSQALPFYSHPTIVPAAYTAQPFSYVCNAFDEMVCIWIMFRLLDKLLWRGSVRKACCGRGERLCSHNIGMCAWEACILNVAWNFAIIIFIKHTHDNYSLCSRLVVRRTITKSLTPKLIGFSLDIESCLSRMYSRARLFPSEILWSMLIREFWKVWKCTSALHFSPVRTSRSANVIKRMS